MEHQGQYQQIQTLAHAEAELLTPGLVGGDGLYGAHPPFITRHLVPLGHEVAGTDGIGYPHHTEQIRHGREGLVGERPPHEIGMHALRTGDNVGEHTIIFSTLGETLELVHKGHTRDSYARGALLAAKFLAGKPPGRYTMNDVLGL